MAPDPEDTPIPWPDIAPLEVEGAVIVGQVGASPLFIWHCVTQDAAQQAGIEALPQYIGDGYTTVKGSGVANDVMEALWEESGPDGPFLKRGKMKNKPGSGVIAEDLPPQFFAGVPAP